MYAIRSYYERDFFQFPSKIILRKSIHDIINTSEQKESKFYYDKSIYYEKLKEQMTKKETIYQWRRVYVRENKSNLRITSYNVCYTKLLRCRMRVMLSP